MADFAKSLTAKLARRGIAASEFCNLSNAVERRIVKEYGAVFLNADAEVEMPDRCCFKNESEVAAFQVTLKISKRTIGGCMIELQRAAMNALLKAADAVAITPKGACPARRSFADVQISWDETVKAATDYWRENPNSEGKTLSAKQAENLESLAGERQIKLIFELEEQNFLFHPDRARSIAVYTAIPGASQHLLMLALDIEEYADEKVRGALAENGWFQTVVSDLPHFTYLGVSEKELPKLGLKKVENCGQMFWIPNI